MKLVRMLQKAHAAELAAYYAYEGHWRSLENVERAMKVYQIQLDELEHVEILEKMLKYLKAKPSWWRDAVFTVIGKTMSFLCYPTGWLLPMWGALIIEKMGVDGYYEILSEALYCGHPELCITFMAMMRTEEEHKKYFEELLNE